MTVLQHIERKTWGAPTPAEIEQGNKAREHFLKYCDSEKCIRGRQFVISALNKGWHKGLCLECHFNPYNMNVEIIRSVL